MHFCLSEGAHRRERKRVAVDIGLPELEVRERFGCPLRGRKVEALVLGRTEAKRVRGNPLKIDCHDILSEHLTGTANIPARHDGRHMSLVNTALALRTDRFTADFVRLLKAAAQSNDDIFLTVFCCKHGRHRSLAVTMLYTILLTILGADLTIILPEEKRCHCGECDSESPIKLRAGELDDWMESISDSVRESLRTDSQVPQGVRTILQEIFQFMASCPVGFDSRV